MAAYSAPPDLLARFNGPLCSREDRKGRRGEGTGGVKEGATYGKRKGREGEGKETEREFSLHRA